MRTITIFILLAIIFSCKVKKQETYINFGKFKAIGKDFNDELLLNPDKTFVIIFRTFGRSVDCSGTWVFDGSDCIVLTCAKPLDIKETLQGGYLRERVMTFKIKDSNTIYYKNNHFERVKSDSLK